MNRLDHLKELRAKGEGILSVTLAPSCLWDFNQAYELIDMLLSAGMNQLLNIVYEPDSAKMSEVAPAEVMLLKKGMESGYRTEMISLPMMKIRERYPDLPIITTVHMGEMFCYGQKRYLKKCVEVGMDGLDSGAYQSVEDPVGFRKEVEDLGMYFISCIFTTSIDFNDPAAMERAGKIVGATSGELNLCPGQLGDKREPVNGEKMKVYVDYLRQVMDDMDRQMPIIGIGGVSTPDDAYQMALAGADGVHTSTAFMNRLLANEPYEKIEKFLREFKEAAKPI